LEGDEGMEDLTQEMVRSQRGELAILITRGQEPIVSYVNLIKYGSSLIDCPEHLKDQRGVFILACTIHGVPIYREIKANGME
jgi:hypothetical protein